MYGEAYCGEQPLSAASVHARAAAQHSSSGFSRHISRRSGRGSSSAAGGAVAVSPLLNERYKRSVTLAADEEGKKLRRRGRNEKRVWRLAAEVHLYYFDLVRYAVVAAARVLLLVVVVVCGSQRGGGGTAATTSGGDAAAGRWWGPLWAVVAVTSGEGE